MSSERKLTGEELLFFECTTKRRKELTALGEKSDPGPLSYLNRYLLLVSVCDITKGRNGMEWKG
jgi:hypothetical protein